MYSEDDRKKVPKAILSIGSILFLYSIAGDKTVKKWLEIPNFDGPIYGFVAALICIEFALLGILLMMARHEYTLKKKVLREITDAPPPKANVDNDDPTDEAWEEARAKRRLERTLRWFAKDAHRIDQHIFWTILSLTILFSLSSIFFASYTMLVELVLFEPTSCTTPAP